MGRGPAVILLTLSWFASAEALAAPASSTRPNILVIIADDLGYTDIGAFGGEIATPQLDRLALQGIRLSNFHTSASCAPTRAMLLTGTDNHLAGMGSQSGLETPLQAQYPQYRNALLPQVPTLPERLREAGYRTYMAGKWHLGHAAESRPAARGFDRSTVLLEGGGGHFDAAPLFERYGQASWLEDDQPITLPDDFYSTDFLADRVIAYIRTTPAEQPFFALFAPTAPHWPLQAPAETIASYRGRYDEGWDVLRQRRLAGARSAGVIPAQATGVHTEAGLEPWASLDAEARAGAVARMEVYAAMIHRLDENVGRLMSALQTAGRMDNTIIVFASDNGAEAHDMEARANVGGWVDANFDNTPANIGTASSYTALQVGWARATAVPFRASKSKVSEGGIRVPAFVRLPGGQAARSGSVSAHYMRIMDLAPTFLELAGLQPDQNMMGRSLLNSWYQGLPVYAANDVIAFELYGRRGAQRGDWKILLQEDPYGTSEWQLYDLAQDPGEQQDLSSRFPQIRADLIRAWQAYADQVGVVLPERPIPY